MDRGGKQEAGTKEKQGNASLNFRYALTYPFRRPRGLCNILWCFVPIIGWLFFIGYAARIVQSFVKGQYHALPRPDGFVTCTGTGFFSHYQIHPAHPHDSVSAGTT